MWTIRNYRTVDFSRLLAVRTAIAAAAPKTEAEASTELQAQLTFPGRDPCTDGYLVHDNTDTIGFGWIHVEVAIGVAVAEIGILPSYRRRGIGGALIKILIQAAQLRSLSELRFNVDDREEGMVEFLTCNGFRPIRDFILMRALQPELRRSPRTNAPRVKIRPFTAPDDVPALMKIQNEAFKGSFGYCPNTVEEVCSFLNMRGGHEGLFFASAYDPDEIDGCVWSRLPAKDVSEHDALTARIEMIGVRPSARGQGIGSALLSTALSAAERRGASSVELDVDSKNQSAAALYRRYGFRQTGLKVCFGINLDC